ncbi:MAG: MBL fold metallo-hydrolase [Dehalococcoidia bacterium]|nr:MBL fold metallo-hydrolase [Dehalococcoidia bacterium]
MSVGTVRSLGDGAYLFHWPAGFYLSPFLVTADGVVAIDPISSVAARAYREAIASVTDAPVRAIIYSHDHRDHIVGAADLAPDAEIIAHPLAAARIAARRDPDIRPPHRTVDDGDVLRFGRHEIQVRYFGPNHSRSNIALILPTGAGPLLSFCDVVEPDVAPYRELPDTDFAGLLHTLDAMATLEVAAVLGGHAGPGSVEWIRWYRQYFDDLLAATAQAYQASGGQTPMPGEDGVAMTERVRQQTCQAAADAVRSTWGHWRGFDAWAPRTADRILSYLITGN